MEPDTVFRLLCPSSKTAALNPKLRPPPPPPGAKVRIEHPNHGGDECVVLIFADPNDQSPNNAAQILDKDEGSPAQQALVRVFRKAALDDAGEAEKGNSGGGGSVCCRLLVASSQVGCVLGRGGKIVKKIRQESGAHVRILPRDQIPPFASTADELIKVIGSLPSVQDALFHITSRIRETIFPMRPPYANFNGRPYMSPFPEMPPPSFRPRNNPASPGSYPSPGFHHGVDHSAFPSQTPDHQPSFSHDMDHNGPAHMDRVPYSFGNERPGHGPAFESHSPRACSPKGVSCATPRGAADVGSGWTPRNGSRRR